VGPRPFDARPVPVDGHHVRDDASQVPGQESVSTTHVKGPRRAEGDRAQDDPVVVEVVIPAPGAIHGAAL
jgi:hypothetical protein